MKKLNQDREEINGNGHIEHNLNLTIEGVRKTLRFLVNKLEGG